MIPAQNESVQSYLLKIIVIVELFSAIRAYVMNLLLVFLQIVNVAVVFITILADIVV